MGVLKNISRKIAAKYGKHFNFFVKNSFKSTNDAQNSDIDFYTVAFNNDTCIDYQIKLLKKNIVGNYTYTVIDNSTKSDVAEKIKKLCLDNNINYYKVKVNLPSTTPSDNHGLVLNWTYYNIIKNRGNDFAFIDHDIFPVKKCNIKKYLQNHKIAGFKITNDNTDKWFIWPGLFFGKLDFLKDFEVNFLPCKRCDTGGSNFDNIYAKISSDSLNFLDLKVTKIRDNVSKDNIDQLHYNCVHEIDDWLHTLSANTWIDTKDKEEDILKILNDCLKD